MPTEIMSLELPIDVINAIREVARARAATSQEVAATVLQDWVASEKRLAKARVQMRLLANGLSHADVPTDVAARHDDYLYGSSHKIRP